MTTYTGPITTKALDSQVTAVRLGPQGSASFTGALDVAAGIDVSGGVAVRDGFAVLSQRTLVSHTASAGVTVATVPASSQILDFYVAVVSTFNASADAVWGTVHIGFKGTAANEESFGSVNISSTRTYHLTGSHAANSAAAMNAAASAHIVAKVTGLGSVANPNEGNFVVTTLYSLPD